MESLRLVLFMSTRKPPKKLVRVGVIVVVESKAPFIREEVKRQITRGAGWRLLEESDGPSLRLYYSVTLRGE